MKKKQLNSVWSDFTYLVTVSNFGDYNADLPKYWQYHRKTPMFYLKPLCQLLNKIIAMSRVVNKQCRIRYLKQFQTHRKTWCPLRYGRGHTPAIILTSTGTLVTISNIYCTYLRACIYLKIILSLFYIGSGGLQIYKRIAFYKIISYIFFLEVYWWDAIIKVFSAATMP